jgi:protoporphyrinogen oxidase
VDTNETNELKQEGIENKHSIPQVAIIGGGIMGISLGYYLSKQQIPVTIYEASPSLGGLAGPIYLDDGTAIDRFYHAILSSDQHLRELCKELGIDGKLRFQETKMGFYHKGDIHPMNDLLDFLKFPPLDWIDRFRLGLTILSAQVIRDWYRLESISVENWLIRLSGKKTFENIWRPMLKAKFDGNFQDTPATYIWSRLVRMKSTRSGARQKEECGHLIGGYITLLQAMAKKIEASGGELHMETPVQEIIIKDGKAIGLRISNKFQPFDAIIGTVQVPVFRRLIPTAPETYHDFLSKTEYLGIIATLLVLDRPLTGYWTLNITDENIPFTGVIETTSYIDPKYVGGHHLVYLPKYTAPGSSWQKMNDEEIKKAWIDYLEKMFPKFNRNWIRYFLVHREKYVEPIHGLNSTNMIPTVDTPVKNLFLATTTQIYPGLTNGEQVIQHANNASEVIASYLHSKQ